MGVSPAGGCDGRCRINGGGDLSLLPLYHSLTFYCGQAGYGPMSCSEVESGIKGGHAVVGAGQIGIGEDQYISWGGGGKWRDGGEMDGKETDMNFVVGCFSKHNLRN